MISSENAIELKENLEQVDKLLLSKEYKSIIKKWIRNKAKEKLKGLGCGKWKNKGIHYMNGGIRNYCIKESLCSKCQEEKEIYDKVILK